MSLNQDYIVIRERERERKKSVLTLLRLLIELSSHSENLLELDV